VACDARHAPQHVKVKLSRVSVTCVALDGLDRPLGYFVFVANEENPLNITIESGAFPLTATPNTRDPGAFRRAGRAELVDCAEEAGRLSANGFSTAQSLWKAIARATNSMIALGLHVTRRFWHAIIFRSVLTSIQQGGDERQDHTHLSYSAMALLLHGSYP